MAQQPKELMYPCACDEEGRLIFAPDAKRGPSYACVGCQQPMILRRGEKRRAYFAHHALNCTPESVLHQLAKSLIKNGIEQALDMGASYPIIGRCHDCDDLHEGDLARGPRVVRMEAPIANVRADLLLVLPTSEQVKPLVAVEVIVTHPPEQTTLQEYVALRLPVVLVWPTWDTVLTLTDGVKNVQAAILNRCTAPPLPRRRPWVQELIRRYGEPAAQALEGKGTYSSPPVTDAAKSTLLGYVYDTTHQEWLKGALHASWRFDNDRILGVVNLMEGRARCHEVYVLDLSKHRYATVDAAQSDIIRMAGRQQTERYVEYVAATGDDPCFRYASELVEEKKYYVRLRLPYRAKDLEYINWKRHYSDRWKEPATAPLAVLRHIGLPVEASQGPAPTFTVSREQVETMSQQRHSMYRRWDRQIQCSVEYYICPIDVDLTEEEHRDLRRRFAQRKLGRNDFRLIQP